MTAREKIYEFKNSRKTKTMFFFLLLSSVFWFFTALSDNYTYLTTYTINYTNLPDNLILQNIPKSEILSQIETSGFRIISHKLKQKSIDIDISEFVKSGKYTYYYLPNAQVLQLQKQLKDNVARFEVDSLFLNLDVLTSKKVPVRLVLNIDYKPGYRLKSKSYCNPDSVLVKGSEKFLDSIHFVNTKVILKNSVDESFSKEVALERSKNNTVTYNIEKVLTHVEVAKYTEEQISIPITVLNLPKAMQMAVFPSDAKIIYEFSFEDYKKIDASSFAVSCNYPGDTLNNSKLKLDLSRKPSFITDYSIHPKHVSYLIEHKK
jgi:hypothetical protein